MWLTSWLTTAKMQDARTSNYLGSSTFIKVPTSYVR